MAVVTGWLPPLLDRIARNSTTVVCPVIDTINDNTLRYEIVPVSVGGFGWNLQVQGAWPSGRMDGVLSEFIQLNQNDVILVCDMV
jgi:hypothetical protein